jgi:endoglucanase
MSRLFRRGFVRASGTLLLDDDGPIPLRGIGLGTWLLPEGYMWRFGDALASPRQIETRILDLVGPVRAATFWQRFRAEFIADADFAMIARAGFDHVRLPINARGVMTGAGDFIEEGFALIERAVTMSETHGLRILLDLHGAPGGQTGTNIDDAPNGKPELFMDAAYRLQTIALWRELARRYRDRESVLGYDLLNEPLPNEWQHRYEAELVGLYRDLTAAIREIDDRHLIVYEGSHWATNWGPLSERFDDNQALQFHRYWCPPDESSIAEYLAVRDALGTPIYMGEGGENTPEWIYAMTQLYERHDIGWNFWTWKKLQTVTSPLSIVRPAEWELIADPAQHPDAEHAWGILEQYLDSIAADRCEPQPAIIAALFARPSLRIPAWAGTQRGLATTVAGRPLAALHPGLWEHTFGEPYAADEHPVVELEEGDRLAFALSERPASWAVETTTPGAVSARWNGSEIVLEAVADVRIRGLTLARTDNVEP